MTSGNKDVKIGENDTAQRLRMLRAKANLTQKEVSKRLELSQQTYSKYENGSAKMDSDTIIKVCALYGISSDYLLGVEERQFPGISVLGHEVGAGSGQALGRSDKMSGREVDEEYIHKIVRKVLAELNQNK